MPELVEGIYRARGIDGLFSLEGNFALIISDTCNRRLIAMRDRMGNRPLYWSKQGEQIRIGGQLSELVEQTGCRTEHPEFLKSFFELKPSGPSTTPFDGIQLLETGSALIVENGQIRLERSPWVISSGQTGRNTPEWIDQFSATFSSAVASTLGGTGPVASMLSGGLDSGPISLVAHELLQGTGRELIPISWALPGHPRADETRWLRTWHERLGGNHILFNGDQLLPFSRLDSNVIDPGSPHFNAFRLLKLECYRQAAVAGCKVILNGHAGDNIYPQRGLLLIDQWRRREWAGIQKTLSDNLKRVGLAMLWRDPAIRHPIGLMVTRSRTARNAAPWLTEWAASIQGASASTWPPEADEHPFPAYARQLIGTRMTSGLAMENEFAHRYGIERRDPFQTEAMARLMLEMPFSMSFRENSDKWIMRQAMKGRMPETVRLKRRTGLLNSFFDAGFNKNRKQIHELLFKRNQAWQRYVRKDYVEDALRKTDTTEKAKLVVTRCIGYALWREYWDNPPKP